MTKTYPRIHRLAKSIAIDDLRNIIADMDEILWACQRCETHGMLSYHETEEHEVLAAAIYHFLNRHLETLNDIKIPKVK